jgi:hypothetical protein
MAILIKWLAVVHPSTGYRGNRHGQRQAQGNAEDVAPAHRTARQQAPFIYASVANELHGHPA